MFRLKQCLSLCSNCFRHSYQSHVLKARAFSSNKDPIDYDDAPIKYSTSKARDYKAKFSRIGTETNRLWYEPYVIIVSLTAFLLYFCVFREENDIDKELARSLYSRIDGLEETQLKLSLRYNLDNGLDTTNIAKRLDEINEEKAKQMETEKAKQMET